MSSDNLFVQLQQQLDQYSMGFPKTESGIEIKILKYLFSETDAELFLKMTPRLEAAADVAARLERPADGIAAQLDDMAERGLLFRVIKNGLAKYGAIPFVHGLFEFQVATLKPDLARMIGEYMDEGFDAAMQNGADHFLRTIPVQRSVEVTHHVAAFEDAAAILRSKPSIVIAECICRKRAQVVEEGCDRPLEACFMFGSMGQYYLDRNMGREVDLDEALKILADCHEAGLVTQPATAQNPGGMCNCCGDCCGVLKAVSKHPRPASIVFSNHYAVVDEDACTGCETCLERCQMEALTMNADDRAEVNIDRCIGCGLCVTVCPSEALSLMRKSTAEYREPPASTAEQMLGMAQKRGLI